MTPELTPYVIAAWVVAVLAAFPSLPPHRAVLLAVLSGTLFLPESGGLELGPVKLSKYLAISYAALLGALLYDSGRLFAPARRWFDWPMILWCFWPLPSVLLNPPPPDGSAPLRDALSQALNTAVTWGVPYLLGRAYFGSREALRDLAVGIVFAAAVYAPLCVWESRMSPRLHAVVYGFSQHDFLQTIRFGGYRPIVFTPHGLCLSMFMCIAAVLAVWLRKPLALPGYLLLLVPLCVLLRSTGALMLGVAGVTALWLARATGSRWWLLLLVVAPPAYVVGRTTGVMTGHELVEWTSANIEEDRAQSLDFRLFHENMLIQKALEKPLLGLGRLGPGAGDRCGQRQGRFRDRRPVGDRSRRPGAGGAGSFRRRDPAAGRAVRAPLGPGPVAHPRTCPGRGVRGGAGPVGDQQPAERDGRPALAAHRWRASRASARGRIGADAVGSGVSASAGSGRRLCQERLGFAPVVVARPLPHLVRR